MRIGSRKKRVQTDNYAFEIARTVGGVIEIWGDDDFALAAGTGFAHMHDRAVQMLMVRSIGQGRVCQDLRDGDESLRIDLAMRSLDFAGAARRDAEHLTSAARRFAEAYAEGANYYRAHHRLPLEFRILRWQPDPWRAEDCLLCINLMSYLGLAQSQQDAEKFLIQAAVGGVPVEALRYLFAPHLHEYTPELIELLRQTQITSPLIPAEIPFLSAMTGMVASNNWAIAADRSKSGSALECHDPHLESNRLPPIWTELVLHTPDDFRIGVNMPGLPGLAMGRTRQVSLGFTYGYMDMIDYFLEDCDGGNVRKPDGWQPLQRRTEVIERRGGPAVQATYWETDCGVLEGEAADTSGSATPPQGMLLCRAFARRPGGAAHSLAALHDVLRAEDVSAAQDILRHVSIAANWIIADRSGNIGFQQSGTLPARRGTGLTPLPGWEADARWQGFVPVEKLHRVLNPPEGFLLSANEDQNAPAGPLSVNLHHGFDRSDRIRELLAELPQATLADMRRMQVDLYSKHAEKFLKLWRPLIPADLPAGRMLLDWDLRYNLESQAASLFENVYAELGRQVLGERCFGKAAWDEITQHSGLPALFYSYFDRPLLRAGDDFDEAFWYGEAGWEQVTAAVLHRVLEATNLATLPRWGERQQVMMNNILLGAKLPKFARFDYGPVAMPGGRGTIVQSVIYESHGRSTNHFPSYRAVTDLGLDEVETANGGGPSGRAWSRHYLTDIPMWLRGEYKKLRG